MIQAHATRQNVRNQISTFLLICLTLTGCGGISAPETGTVTGSVSVHGNPLTTGTVNFYNRQTAAGAQATMDPRGEFKVHGELPTGTYVVFVLPAEPPMPVMEDGNNPAPLVNDTSDFPDVPPQYQNGDQSDVTIEVKAGENNVFITIPP